MSSKSPPASPRCIYAKYADCRDTLACLLKHLCDAMQMPFTPLPARRRRAYTCASEILADWSLCVMQRRCRSHPHLQVLDISSRSTCRLQRHIRYLLTPLCDAIQMPFTSHPPPPPSPPPASPVYVSSTYLKTMQSSYVSSVFSYHHDEDAC